MKNCIYNQYNKLSFEIDFLKSKNLLVINNIKSNIGDLLINNCKIKKSIKYKYKNCTNSICNICKFSYKLSFLKNNTLFLPFKSNSNCNSIGFIYIIICKKCNVFYIGESKRKVKDRLNEHIRNIKNFKINLNESLINIANKTEVAIHFNERGHDLESDLKFCIFECNINFDPYRKSIETDLINMFKRHFF